MKKIIFVIVLFIIFLFVYINVNAEIVIPSDAIRVRVIPNSNSVIDQDMKDKVKNYVSNYMMIKLDGIYDTNEARKIIVNSINQLNKDINDLFKKNNYDMNYKVIYGNNYFPNKVYKGVIYDKGNYESLVVYIGEAKGDNWWCVLFPPLCLLEASESETGEIEYRSLVKDLLDKIF